MIGSNNKGVIETDVLVIGGGLAGCRAALRAKDFVEKVILVDKAVVARSGATIYGHEIIAPVPEDSFKAWMEEVVLFTEYFSDQTWVEILLKEGKERLRELDEWGAPFKKDDKGELISEPVRGMINCKAIFFDGRFWFDKVKEQLKKKEIELMERVMITDLLTSDGKHPTKGRVIGAVGFHTVTGEFLIFNTKAVIIATGMMTAKLRTAYGDNMTGDGQAMAFRAGTELANLEFCLAPSFFSKAAGVNLIHFQNHGAYMINAHGERYMGKYFPDRMERGSGFGQLAQAFVKETLEGKGPCFFDMRHWNHERIELMRKIIPVTMTRLDQAGIDIGKQLVEFTMTTSIGGAQGEGGVNVNINGGTNIPGLFCAGASARARGGPEVFGSVTLSNCNVFGYRTGENAGKTAKGYERAQIDWSQVESLKEIALSPLKKWNGIRPEDIYHGVIKKILPWQYSVFKHEKRIKEAIDEVRRIEEEDLPGIFAKDTHELVKANEARNFVLMVKLYHISSLQRKESRLRHYREEYPYKDNIDWLKFVVLRKEEEGLKIEFEPIPINDYPIRPNKLDKISAPIKFS